MSLCCHLDGTVRFDARPRRVLKRRLPRQVYPEALEKQYAGFIHAYLEAVAAAAQEIIDQHLGPIVALNLAVRADGYAEDQTARLIAQVTARIRGVPIDTGQIAEAAGRVSLYQRRQLERTLNGRPTLSLKSKAQNITVAITDKKIAPRLAGFALENAQAIRGAGDKIAADIGNLVAKGIQDGTRFEEMRTSIAASLDTSLKKAELIARDQTGKLYGQLNADRQKSLGVTQFIWRTMLDNRVRSEHEDREGETYDYSDPPDGELPGEPILCRCFAEPVIPE